MDVLIKNINILNNILIICLEKLTNTCTSNYNRYKWNVKQYKMEFC